MNGSDGETFSLMMVMEMMEDRCPTQIGTVAIDSCENDLPFVRG